MAGKSRTMTAFDRAYIKFAKKHKMPLQEGFTKSDGTAESVKMKKVTDYDPWSLKKAVEYGKSYYKDKEE